MEFEFFLKKRCPTLIVVLPRWSLGSLGKSSFSVDRLGFGFLITLHSRKPSSHCSICTGLCFCFVVLISSTHFLPRCLCSVVLFLYLVWLWLGEDKSRQCRRVARLNCEGLAEVADSGYIALNVRA